MMRSLFSGVSALTNHQTRMDVIGNNIANVNTVGFKSSRVTFKDTLNQTLRAASGPAGDRGGTNPIQVGLGMALGAIQTDHTQGSPESTGRQTDVAIEGNGFFILADGPRRYYTRAGVFDLDGRNSLISSTNGMKVMGWMADSQGDIDSDQSVEALTIPMGQSISPIATSEVAFGGNLDARFGENEQVIQTVEIFDSLGDTHLITFTFTKDSSDSNRSIWNWEASSEGRNSGGTVVFGTDGGYIRSTGPALAFRPPGAEEVRITPDFSGVVQTASESTLGFKSQNGYPQGTMVGYNITDSGIIVGEFSNGRTKNIGQIATAVFGNPGGLVRVGDTAFSASPNSGEAEIGRPGTGANGKLSPGALEMSNVNLSEEFTDMIVTQRGFQANSRIITTSDEMLQELVNLKR